MALVKIQLENSFDFWRQKYNELVDYITPGSGNSLFKSDFPSPGSAPIADANGTFIASWLRFDGTLLVNANADLLDGQHGAFYQNASNLNAGSIAAARIANDTITNAMSANMAESTIKGRAVGAGVGDPTDLTGTQLMAVLNTSSGVALTVDSGGGTNAVVSEGGIDRSSGVAETFNIQNSGAGTIELQVDGTAVALKSGNTFTGENILADVNPSTSFSAGFRGMPQNIKNEAYTLVLGDSGKHIFHDEVTTRNYTIPENTAVSFPVGSTTTFVNNNGAGSLTISINGTDILRRGDGIAGTGTRNIPANAIATIIKTKSTEWMITGKFT